MTKASIIALLARNDRAVEAAMVALYQRQTEDEQHTSSTSHSNGRGFNYQHAEIGSDYARWVMGGRHLTPKQLVVARRIATYYARQLGEIASARRARARSGSCQAGGQQEAGQGPGRPLGSHQHLRGDAVG